MGAELRPGSPVRTGLRGALPICGLSFGHTALRSLRWVRGTRDPPPGAQVTCALTLGLELPGALWVAGPRSGLSLLPTVLHGAPSSVSLMLGHQRTGNPVDLFEAPLGHR